MGDSIEGVWSELIEGVVAGGGEAGAGGPAQAAANNTAVINKAETRGNRVLGFINNSPWNAEGHACHIPLTGPAPSKLVQ
jgi:hypothetical protein